MATLPQLIEEDIQELEDVLRELLESSDATTALIIDKGGFLIAHQGDGRQFDLTTIAALASGAYLANQTIANLVHETDFSSVYQQGKKFSLFVMCVDECCLLAVIFKAHLSVAAAGAGDHHAIAVDAAIAPRRLQCHDHFRPGRKRRGAAKFYAVFGNDN